MTKHPHTTDQCGFDYMANTGREEKDRDCCGLWLAVGLTAFLTICQYLKLY